MGKRLNIASIYSDKKIAWRVRDFFGREHFPILQSLEISTHRGVVTLTGQVASFYEKQVAMSVCLRVPGVIRIVDRIDVRDDAVCWNQRMVERESAVALPAI